MTKIGITKGWKKIGKYLLNNFAFRPAETENEREYRLYKSSLNLAKRKRTMRIYAK